MSYGYRLLANAIIQQAAMDYRRALCAKRGKKTSEVMELERFFASETFILYNDKVDGPKLASLIRKECEECNYDMKTINESIRGKRRCQNN